MPFYARLENNEVREIVEVDGDVYDVYPRTLEFVQFDGRKTVEQYYIYDPETGEFSPPPPPPGPTQDQIIAEVLAQRDSMMQYASIRIAALSDIIEGYGDEPATEEDERLYKAWRTYRATLQKLTSQAGYPNNVVWPTEPED